MSLFTLLQVVQLTHGRQLARGDQDLDRAVRRVWTDSRTALPGDLFVALTGERFDGHRYVDDAFKKGAVAALVREGFSGSDMGVVIEVEDPLRAFQDLAAAHRRRFKIPVVAVSGSNGKTTTKEMIGRVLAERYETLVTAGNLNNHIGVPQTLFRLTKRHQAAVIEMGISNLGEMTRLCEIAGPTHAVLTNIGPTHLESLGTIEKVAEAKGELLSALPSKGTAILNADDRFFTELATRVKGRVVSFGFDRDAEIRAVQWRCDAPWSTLVMVRIPGRKRPVPVHLNMAGRHNVANALAAVATGLALGVGVAAVRAGLARYRPAAMRSEVRRWRGVTILNDCYNANPASVQAALHWLADAKTKGRGIAVLGDMLELGSKTVEFHREIGRELPALADYLLVTGVLAGEIANAALITGMKPDHVMTAKDHAELADRLRAVAKSGDVVLLKGSRGARMEKVLEAL